MFEVILYQPEIPPNTGNVIRLCANTGCRLHLIEPLGFSLDDARLRRAGLDYHEYATVRVHPDLAACLHFLDTQNSAFLGTQDPDPGQPRPAPSGDPGQPRPAPSGTGHPETATKGGAMGVQERGAGSGSSVLGVQEQVAGRLFAFSTRGRRRHDQVAWRTGDRLLFGPETRGLPQPVLDRIPAARQVRLPMRPGNRSLNLGNTVAVAVFEGWRQLGFAGSR